MSRGGSEPEAIFIVGVPRSGTTMMRALLETSERIAIARENHFMGHILGRRGARHFFRRAGDLADDATVREIVDMIYSGEYERLAGWRRPSPYWFWLKDNVAREELERRLIEAERSERGMFAAFMRVYADSHGKAIMGEKTPTHLAYVDELLGWFPNARVLHMLRDPRAVYVSDRYRRRSKGRKPYTYLMKIPLLLESYLLVLTIVSWRRAIRLHSRLERDHSGRYQAVSFRGRRLDTGRCTASDIRFPRTCRSRPEPKSVGLRATHGMRSKDEGIDPEAATRWRTRIHPLARRLPGVLAARSDASIRLHGLT